MDIISSYLTIRDEYERFSKAIERILKHVLYDNQIKHQSITSRCKDPKSLENKIRTKSYTKLEDITDLAGCRIIFYLERDVTSFRNRIYSTFGRENIVEDVPKFSDDGYNANHLTIKFGEDRLSLAEYSSFKGFVCEIQLTNVLYHSWSELNHDTFYKCKDGLADFDKEAFANLKSKFSNIMKKYIKEAMVEYELATIEYEKIEAGFSFFQAHNLTIGPSGNNDQIVKFLQGLKKIVGSFGDKTPGELKLGTILSQCLERAKTNKVEDQVIHTYTINGKTFEDVLRECCDIYRMICYQKPSEAISFLFSYATYFELSNHNNQFVSLADKLFKPNIYIIEKVGYSLQDHLLEELRKYRENDSKDARVINLYAFSCLLKADFSSSYSQGRKINFSSGPVPFHETIRDFRVRAYSDLFDYYSELKRQSDKIELLKIFNRCTIAYNGKEASESFLEMMRLERQFIFDFLLFHVATMGTVERQFAQEFVNSFASSVTEYDLELFRGILETTDFAEFEQLITPLSKDWLHDKEYDRYVMAVKQSLSHLDKNKIITLKSFLLSLDESIDLMTDNNYFNAFMAGLGEALPGLGLELTTIESKNLKKYLRIVLRGSHNHDPLFFELMCVDLFYQGFEVEQVVQAIGWKEQISDEVIEIMVKSVIAHKVFHSAPDVINGICRNKGLNDKRKNELVAKVLRWLVRSNENVSIHHSLPFLKNTDYPQIFSKQFDLLMKYIVRFERLEPLDYFLAEWAKFDQVKVLDMLLERIELEGDENFEPVPFDFHYLDKFYQSCGAATKRYFFKHGAKLNGDKLRRFVRLAGVLFSLEDEELQTELLDMMKSPPGVELAYMILYDRFEPISIDNNIFLKLIEVYPRSKENWDYDLHMILMKTGVSTGEDGYLNKIKAKLSLVEQLILDYSASSSIQEFLLKAKKRLEKDIAHESKDLELKLGAEKRDIFLSD